jgi:hypothetical protein
MFNFTCQMVANVSEYKGRGGGRRLQLVKLILFWLFFLK